MIHEAVLALPAWLLWGVALGLLGSLAAAAVFLVGVRLFPTRPPEETARSTGDDRRRGEIRDYLDAIGESYTEGRAVEGERVAFYLPDRDVAVTFDPRAFYRIERSPTHAVLVEHEMPAAMLGYRLPFETPTPGAERWDSTPEAPGGRDPRATAFDTLGLPAGASPEEVRAAYRERVKEVHPDHGGDEEAFRRVREAYTTARQEVGT